MVRTVRISLVPILTTLVAACVLDAPEPDVEVVERELATNDFTIAVNPVARDLEVASSTTYQIETTVASGSAQTIHLTVSGLPWGVSGSFNPATITAGQSSILKLSAALMGPLPPDEFTITGTGSSVTHSVSAWVTVVPYNRPPNVTITSPAEGSTVSGLVTVSANVTDVDGTVESVRFLVGDQDVTITTPPYQFAWDSTAQVNGSTSIWVFANDDDGSTGFDFGSFNVQNGP